MRLVHYYVIEKATGKKVFVNCSHIKAQEYLATLEDKESYYIGYKWLSI
jgi:hypothetical protein